MESLWVLIPLSLVATLVIGGAFWWSVNSGQLDDLEAPATRIVMDDDRVHSGQDRTTESARTKAKIHNQ